MSPLVLVLTLVGGCAVVLFLAFCGVGLAKGWRTPLARRFLYASAACALVCAVIGVGLAFVDV